MGKVVDFNSGETMIEFGDVVKDNSFLQLSSINAIQELEYDNTEDGVKEFQRDFQLPETGIIGIPEIIAAIQVFEPAQRQYVLETIDRALMDRNRIMQNKELMRIAEEQEQELQKHYEEEKKAKKKQTFLSNLFGWLLVILFLVILISGSWFVLKSLWNFLSYITTLFE